MLTQVAVRLDDEEVAELDRLVEAGIFPSRAAAIRAALAAERRAAEDREIAAAYAGPGSGLGDPPWPSSMATSRCGTTRHDRRLIVLTRNVAIPVLTNVTVALVTRSAVGSPAEVTLGPAEGLRNECVANCDNIHTVAERQLVRRVGELGPEPLHRLARGFGSHWNV